MEEDYFRSWCEDIVTAGEFYTGGGNLVCETPVGKVTLHPNTDMITVEGQVRRIHGADDVHLLQDRVIFEDEDYDPDPINI